MRASSRSSIGLSTWVGGVLLVAYVRVYAVGVEMSTYSEPWGVKVRRFLGMKRERIVLDAFEL
jgi:hypothetical protein